MAKITQFPSWEEQAYKEVELGVETRINAYGHPPELAQIIRNAVKEIIKKHAEPIKFSSKVNCSEEEYLQVKEIAREMNQLFVQKICAVRRDLVVVTMENCELEYYSKHLK